MTEEQSTKKIHINRALSYIETSLLPLILAVLFAIQNQAFNKWLSLYSKTYSTRLFLAAFALGIVLYGPSLLFKKRHKYLYLFLVSFLISVIFSAQFIYYKYSQSFLQFSAIRYIDQADSVMGTVQKMLSPHLFLFFSNLLVVLIALILTLRKNYIELSLPKWERAAIIFVMVLSAIIGYKYLLDTEKKEWGNTSRLYSDIYDLKSLVAKIGIMNFFVEDTIKYSLRAGLVTNDDRDFLKTWAAKGRIVQNTKNYFGLAKGRNIIIIQVESLESAVINKKINGQEITPNLNQLTKTGLYFDNYYAQTGPGNTADAEFSTMDSLYPLPNDVVFINYAKNNYKALPNLLKNNGYQTYSLHGDVPTFWNRSNIYPGLGYQKVFGLNDYVGTRPVGKGPSSLGDEDLFSQSLPKLKSFKQPFMATLITMSSHTPFILPADLQTLNISEDVNFNETQKNYLQSIHYTDKAIGEFINGLKNDGLYDNSLILIWGDHGSFTNISSALGENKNILEELSGSQVPMIILAPKTNLRGTSSIPSSHLDIYPTITNLLGFSNPTIILGQDLLNTKNPVETHFELISGGIDTILTSNLVYQANNDGLFINGHCKSWPAQESLPISDCQTLYNQQFDDIRASNIIIRGNLLNNFSVNNP